MWRQFTETFQKGLMENITKVVRERTIHGTTKEDKSNSSLFVVVCVTLCATGPVFLFLVQSTRL